MCNKSDGPQAKKIRHFSRRISLTLWVKVAQSCPSLCDPMDLTVYGILQARILEWVAFLFSRASSQPRNRTGVSCIAGGFYANWDIIFGILCEKSNAYFYQIFTQDRRQIFSNTKYPGVFFFNLCILYWGIAD